MKVSGIVRYQMNPGSGRIRSDDQIKIFYNPVGIAVVFSGKVKEREGLEKRLKNAEEKIRALTPPRGRGKKQITDEAELKEKADEILKKHRVTGFLEYEYEKETERKIKYVGRMLLPCMLRETIRSGE